MFVSLLFGCTPELSLLLDTASESIVETPEEVAYLPTAQVEWGENQLLLHLKNSAGYDFQFGIIESSTSCQQDVDFGCWTGESCDPTTPYSSADEAIILGPFCHPTQGEGVALSLNYSASIESVLLLQDVVSNGVQTAFPRPPIEDSENTETEEEAVESYEFQVTYYLEDLISGKCWAWGINPNYFAARSCSIPLPLSTFSADWSPNTVVLQP